METFDLRAARHENGRRLPRHDWRCVTSAGRWFRIARTGRPRRGESYLKPSGRRGIWNVLVAQNDFAKKIYHIIIWRY